jgi:glycerol kinase
MEAAASALPADGHGLTLLPFPSGERAPGWNLDAKAAIVGLTRATTQPQVYRATLEAVALRLGSIIRLLAGASSVQVHLFCGLDIARVDRQFASTFESDSGPHSSFSSRTPPPNENVSKASSQPSEK